MLPLSVFNSETRAIDNYFEYIYFGICVRIYIIFIRDGGDVTLFLVLFAIRTRGKQLDDVTINRCQPQDIQSRRTCEVNANVLFIFTHIYLRGKSTHTRTACRLAVLYSAVFVEK